MKTLVEKVAEIQKALKAPKSCFNKFGNYAYRNQEDILEALKPLLGNLVLTISDDIVEVGGRIYVKAISTISDGQNIISNSAFAREPDEQKGMSEPMLTGSASSYARKYSLNGLFLIDDTKDADHESLSPKKTEEKSSGFKKVDKTTSETSETVVESKPTTRSFRRK